MVLISRDQENLRPTVVGMADLRPGLDPRHARPQADDLDDVDVHAARDQPGLDRHRPVHAKTDVVGGIAESVRMAFDPDAARSGVPDVLGDLVDDGDAGS